MQSWVVFIKTQATTNWPRENYPFGLVSYIILDVGSLYLATPYAG
jgi:hypothetical protein